MALIVSLGLFLLLSVFAVVLYFIAGSSTLPEGELSQIIQYSPCPGQPAGSAAPSREPETAAGDGSDGQEAGTSEPAALERSNRKSDGIFTILTYNIGYLSGMTNNRSVESVKSLYDRNMATFLKKVNEPAPGILCLQEIDFNSRRSFLVDQMGHIARAAGYTYGARAVNWDKRYVPFPYWPPSVHFGRMLSGQAILSRWPIMETKRHVLCKPAGNPFYYNKFYLDRLLQVVKINMDGRELVIFNLHLEAFDLAARELQARRVMEVYKTYSQRFPVLVVGDFNSVPPQAVKSGYVDEPEADFKGDRSIELFLEERSLSAVDLQTFTYPSDTPTRKLDYIFYNDQLELVESLVLPLDSSDHLPLLARFRFKAKAVEGVR
ncbi:MAG: hypothetical protein GY765_10735 [bacterium]|nr:hypothetical protein [bacterium]